MPNFRETDPSKIAVGFGGTLNLVAGLLFLLGDPGADGRPWHAREMVHPLGVPFYGIGWLYAGMIGGVLLGRRGRASAAPTLGRGHCGRWSFHSAAAYEPGAARQPGAVGRVCP